MTNTDDAKNPSTPRDNDASATDHVEKKPKDKDSPQQVHDDENHG